MMPMPTPITVEDANPLPVIQDRYLAAADFAILMVRNRHGDRRLNDVRVVLEEAERWLRDHPETA